MAKIWDNDKCSSLPPKKSQIRPRRAVQHDAPRKTLACSAPEQLQYISKEAGLLLQCTPSIMYIRRFRSLTNLTAEIGGNNLFNNPLRKRGFGSFTILGFSQFPHGALSASVSRWDRLPFRHQFDFGCCCFLKNGMSEKEKRQIVFLGPSSERTTMSDDGDKVCPLCAEEMDLTDQQLKPCKCGYEICVWCWHHIMEMADKDEKDGRCPACRTPYDKERIVGMSANCERYITYAREDEAVRCIQAVHYYILDGKPLRACFGTTKYCHAWLRNMNCNNPDCLYLHDIGSQEDSFTKDEIISAHTRSRVSQIPTSSLQRRSGIMLPSPTDDWACNGTTSTNKQLVKSSSNNNLGQPKVSNGSIGRSTILPAAASCSDMKLASSAWHDVVQTSDGLEKHATNGDGATSSSELSKAVSSDIQLALDFSNIPLQAVVCDTRDSAWEDEFPVESYDSMAFGRPKEIPPAISPALDIEQQSSGISLPSNSPPHEKEHTAAGFFASSIEESHNINVFSIASKTINAVIGTALETSENNSVLSQTSGTDKNEHVTAPCNNSFTGLLKTPVSKSKSKSNQNDLSESFGNSSLPSSSLVHISSNAPASREPSVFKSESERLFQSTCNGLDDSSLVIVKQMDSDAICQNSCSSHLVESFNKSTGLATSGINRPALTAVPSPFGESIAFSNSVNLLLSSQQDGDELVDNQEGNLSQLHKASISLDSSLVNSNGGSINFDRVNDIDRTEKYAGVPNGENSSFSDILSLNFDPWDDSLSIDNLSRLLGENGSKEGAIVHPRPLNTLNNNQSRFSFARQDNQEGLVESSIFSNNHEHGHRIAVKDSFGDDFEKVFMANGFLGNGIVNNSMTFAAKRPAGVSLAKVSAPPGFSAPNRAPPPGFSVQNRQDQNFGTASEIHLHGNSSYGDRYQVYTPENSADIEFMDPAILAVGKGHLPIGAGNASFGFGSAFPAHFNSPECDPRLQLLMHHSVSSHQNTRVPEHTRNSPLHANDSYLTSCLLAKNYSGLSSLAHLSLQQSRSSPVTSSQWDGWSNLHSSADMGVKNVTVNERFGLNNYYLGKGEHNFHIPSSGDIYGRAFGM
ncbi:hypothetical protein HPP92_017394 [Vanilla planifolia]|uniref:RING-type domain-containing protein n=1 Tax=Vanilla planifolia TaxID=51239 RepID=A0A835Q7X5_VANPL|nr:hypothetical protein HPP92_017394 [Vanilla planifolia]